MIYLSKHIIGMAFAVGDQFIVEFDLDGEGVYAGPADAGKLAFGGQTPQQHVDCSGDALRAELQFSGEWWPINIPWKHVRSVTSAAQLAAMQVSEVHRHGATLTARRAPRLS